MKKNTRDYQMIAEKFLYVSIGITNYPFVLIERYPVILQQPCLFNKIKCLRNWKIIFVNEIIWNSTDETLWRERYQRKVLKCFNGICTT